MQGPLQGTPSRNLHAAVAPFLVQPGSQLICAKSSVYRRWRRRGTKTKLQKYKDVGSFLQHGRHVGCKGSLR